MARFQWLVLAFALFTAPVAEAGWPFHHHHRHSYWVQQPMMFGGFAQQPMMMAPQEGVQQGIDAGMLIRLILGNINLNGGNGGLVPGVADVSGIRSEVSNLSSKLSSVESNLTSRLTTLESKLDDTRGRIDNVAGVVQSLGKNAVEVSARLESLENKFGSLESKLVTGVESKNMAAQLVNDLAKLKDDPKAMMVKTEITKAHEDSLKLRESLLK